jgi:hypothetical protein
VCPVADDFAATIEVWSDFSSSERPPLSVSYMHAGVAYEPLRRLAPLLGVFDLAVLSAVVWPDAAADDLDRDLEAWDDDEDRDDWDDELEDEEDDEDEYQPRELRTLDDADRLAAELAELARERAVPYARRYSDLDVVLKAVPGPRAGSIKRPALLAAAGRFDEARALLVRVPPPAPGLTWMREHRRAARQLERWMDSGGDPALIPAAPPPDAWSSEPSKRPTVAETLAHTRLRQAAVDVVKDAAPDSDRDQLRAILDAELASRGLHESAIWKEGILDQLTTTHAEQWRSLATGIGRIGIGIAKAVRDKQLPDLQQPAILDPPERAAYTLPDTRQTVTIELDPSADAWFDSLDGQIRSMLGIARLEAWIVWDPEPPNPDSVLAVHIGRQRVGQIPAEHIDQYRLALDAATARDELPVLAAILKQRSRPPRYILEIATAPTDTL